jgi:putative ABC transport system permease protein
VVGGANLKTQCVRGVYRFTNGHCLSDNISWRGRALISENAVRKLRLDIGGRVHLEGRDFEVVGVVQEFGTEAPLIVIDQEDFESLYPNHYPDSLTIDLKDPVELEGIKSLLKRQLPATLGIRDQRELFDLVETLFNRTFRVTESVRWIVFVLALLGLVSTGAQYIWERRRELRIAEVIGVAPKTLMLSLVIETTLISAMATFVGVLAGIGIGWCLTDYINPLVFGWSLVFKVSLEPALESAAFLIAVTIVASLVSYFLVRKIVTSGRLEDE